MDPRLTSITALRTRDRFLLVGLLLAAAALPARAAAAADGMDWWTMGMQLFGGLALFLFGMEQMAEALKAVAGERMRLILARLTSNRIMGALTGAFVTAVMQSSSVTTVLVVGFISAGLMSMAQSIGVIMGANIGTTITAQIVAFKVTKAAMLMIAVGFAMLFFSRHERVKQYGGMIMGLGLVFFGMSVMSDAMKPLRSYQPFLDLMVSMETPIIGILVAAVFTGLIQSSSATTGIVIVMAGQGFITLPAGIALAFGANIGTCVTALLASIGKPREALRAALVHVMFNVFGVILWFFLIDQLAALVTWFSPSHPELGGVERLSAEAPRQIANAHTVFNIANTLIFIGLTTQFARLVEWLVPDKPLEEEQVVKPRYLDEELLETPSLALERVRLEIGGIGQRVMEMMQQVMPALLGNDQSRLRRVAQLDDEVDVLHGAIISYLGSLGRKALSDEQSAAFLQLMAAANILESVGDIIETDLVSMGYERIERHIPISEQTQDVLRRVHKEVAIMLAMSINAVIENDAVVARTAVAAKGAVEGLIKDAELHQARRLVADEPNRLVAYTLEIELIEKLKRIQSLAARLADSVVVDTEAETPA